LGWRFPGRQDDTYPEASARLRVLSFSALIAGDVSEPSEETMDYRETMIAEQGQTMAEYAVVLTVITVAIVVTLSVLSTSIIGLVSSVVTAM
jgi:Flp pilus assembly pilin Flp